VLRRGGTAEFSAPQRPEFELLIAFSSGHTTHEVDFARHACAPGDVLWIHAGQVQRWGEISGLTGTAIMFSPDAIPSDVAVLLRSTGALNRNLWSGSARPGTPFSQMLLGLTAVTAECGEAAQGQAQLHATIASLLLLDGSDSLTEATTKELPESYMWLIEEIDRNFMKHRAASWYAHRLGYSERTLNRISREYAETTTKGMIDARVVLEAKRLLMHETTPVSAIATQLSFDDAANFSNYFRRRTGLTPGQFRAQR